jgi:hypothetical protein
MGRRTHPPNSTKNREAKEQREKQLLELSELRMEKLSIIH